MSTRGQVFVAMPNDGSCENIWNQEVLPALGAVKLDAVRLTPVANSEDVIPKIKESIDQCGVLIALTYDRNPHVYFEIGYALAQNKPCIVVTGNPEIQEFFGRSAKMVLTEMQRDGITKELERLLASL